MDKMITEIEIQRVLRDLFRSQRDLVLATDDHGQLFATVTAF